VTAEYTGPSYTTRALNEGGIRFPVTRTVLIGLKTPIYKFLELNTRNALRPFYWIAGEIYLFERWKSNHKDIRVALLSLRCEILGFYYGGRP
jgi:hypothetical protein